MQIPNLFTLKFATRKWNWIINLNLADTLNVIWLSGHVTQLLHCPLLLVKLTQADILSYITFLSEGSSKIKYIWMTQHTCFKSYFYMPIFSYNKVKLP